jgi:hypothetical protein
VSTAPTEEEPVKVAFIGGWGRSGSTLLASMLGEVPRMTPVGELRYIWERGLHDDELCGCGERFGECPFWQAVGREAFGGWDAVDADEVIALDKTNATTAARLVQPLGQWRRYDAARQGLMRAQLDRILATPGLSPNTYEMVSKSLGDTA